MATNIASLAGFAAASNLAEDMDVKEDWPNQVPNRFVILDIDCTLVSGRLEFSFRDPGRAQTLTAGIQGAITEARTRPAGPGTSRFVPLDIGVFGDSIYIFLRIVGPTNMTFSASKKALRHKNADDRDNYGELRHITAAGPASESPLPNCRIVYFVADPISPPNLDYMHGFSLNVEIEQLASDGSTRMIAFEIDPDVRHPGGTTT